ncbi:hypothetical protein H696_01341 [Fonticula alba]|uniref:Uncharacterized protein n=1 Tax=Fonticula alba TaxID=691883 RepID=A0A058ZEQ1_FONAL|nr:hypothetical protein H696_01341 [Fonticula alba]KCV71932.1 hypothetical protein H696_01341 [Fonticula alba]|eukprot:XP_009493510.1 hypothetical protein H696_01341 [Fonticula alba]
MTQAPSEAGRPASPFPLRQAPPPEEAGPLLPGLDLGADLAARAQRLPALARRTLRLFLAGRLSRLEYQNRMGCILMDAAAARSIAAAAAGLEVRAALSAGPGPARGPAAVPTRPRRRDVRLMVREWNDVILQILAAVRRLFLAARPRVLEPGPGRGSAAGPGGALLGPGGPGHPGPGGLLLAGGGAGGHSAGPLVLGASLAPGLEALRALLLEAGVASADLAGLTLPAVAALQRMHQTLEWCGAGVPPAIGRASSSGSRSSSSNSRRRLLAPARSIARLDPRDRGFLVRRARALLDPAGAGTPAALDRALALLDSRHGQQVGLLGTLSPAATAGLAGSTPERLGLGGAGAAPGPAGPGTGPPPPPPGQYVVPAHDAPIGAPWSLDRPPDAVWSAGGGTSLWESAFALSAPQLALRHGDPAAPRPWWWTVGSTLEEDLARLAGAPAGDPSDEGSSPAPPPGDGGFVPGMALAGLVGRCLGPAAAAEGVSLPPAGSLSRLELESLLGRALDVFVRGRVEALLGAVYLPPGRRSVCLGRRTVAAAADVFPVAGSRQATSHLAMALHLAAEGNSPAAPRRDPAFYRSRARPISRHRLFGRL